MFKISVREKPLEKDLVSIIHLPRKDEETGLGVFLEGTESKQGR